MSLRAVPGGGGGGRAAAPLLLLLCGCAVCGQLGYRLSGPPWHVALSDQRVHVDLRGVNGSGHNLSLALVDADTNRTLATVPIPGPGPGSLDLDCSLFRCAGQLVLRLGEWISRPLPVRWPRFQLRLARSARSPGRFQLLVSSAQRLCPRGLPALVLHTGPGPGLKVPLGPGMGLEPGTGPEPGRGAGLGMGQMTERASGPGKSQGPGRGRGPGVPEGEPGPERESGPGELEGGPEIWLERTAGGPEPGRGPDPGWEPGPGMELEGLEPPGEVPGWEVRLELPCPPRSRGSAWTVSLRSPCSPTPLLSRTVQPRYSLALPTAPCRHSAAVRVLASPCVRPRGRVTVYRASPPPPLSLLLAAPPPSPTPPPGSLTPAPLPLSLAAPTTQPDSFSPTTTNITTAATRSATPPGSPLPSLATTAPSPGSLPPPSPPVLAQSWLPLGESIARFNCSLFESGTHEYCFQFVSADTPGARSPLRCVSLHRDPEIRGTWLSWSPCSVTCGDGVRERSRRCLTSSPGSDGCGAESEVSICSLLECSGQGAPAKVHNTSNIVTITGISFCLLVILATIAVTLRTKLSCKGPGPSDRGAVEEARDLCPADMSPNHDPSARLDVAVNIPLGFRRSQLFVPSEGDAPGDGGWGQDTQKGVPPIFGYRLAQQQLKEMQRQGVTEGTQMYLVTPLPGPALPSPGKDDGADTFHLRCPFPAHTHTHCELPQPPVAKPSRDHLAPPFPQLHLALPASPSTGAVGAGGRDGGRPLAAGFRRAASFGESGAVRYYRERSLSSLSHMPRAGEPGTAGDRCGSRLPITAGDRCGSWVPITAGDRCGTNRLPITAGDRCGTNRLPITAGDRCGTNRLPITAGDRCGSRLPITAGDRCSKRLPVTSGDRCGTNRLPITSGHRCANRLPAGDRCGTDRLPTTAANHKQPNTAGDRCGSKLPTTAGDRCGTDRLPTTAGDRCGSKLPTTAGDRCGTDRLPTTAGDRCGSRLPITAGARCAGMHMCAEAEAAGEAGVSGWVFGEVDTFPGRRQRGEPGDGADPGGHGALSRQLCRRGRCRSFPSEPAAMHFDNTAFELSVSEQRIIDLPALFGPHTPGDEDSSTLSSDRLVI
ncbi:uncharacterized protein thsd1 [Rhinoraja longicauda]